MSKNEVGKKGYRNLEKRLKAIGYAVLMVDMTVLMLLKMQIEGDERSRELASRAAREAQAASERARLLESYICERDGDEVVAEVLAQIQTRRLDEFLEQGRT